MNLESIVFALVALAAAYVMFVALPRSAFGPDVSLFNPIRRACLPVLDRVFSEAGGYAETTTDEQEYVGSYTGSLATLEQALFDAGYRRYPLASLAHTPDGRTEIASWARHTRVWDDRQTHVRIYDAKPDIGETDQSAFDVYAHAEYTAHNPLYAHKHYRGIGLSAAEGVAKASDHLRNADVTLEREIGDEDPFEPPFRASDPELQDHIEDIDNGGSDGGGA